MKIIHFTRDLMLASQVEQATRPRGVTLDQVSRLDQVFERIDEQTSLIILDLQCADWSFDGFQQRSQQSPKVPCVAYAQHVHTELLAEAKQIGLDVVLTRGQFAKSIPELVERATSV